METDAQQLSALARQDSLAAMVQLIELHYERIYAFLRRLAGNDADAADLTQRTFGRIQQALPTFAGRSSVGSWMHGIAYHIYVDWRRSNGRTEARPDEWWALHRSPEPGPDQQVLRTDLGARLYACVDRLEADLRQTVHLHYYQDLTLQETADAMGVAVSTVKYRLRQALDALQKQLAAEGSRSAPVSPRPARL
jgi:RNA polymerase sigma-70 factor (ECF subfamily)